MSGSKPLSLRTLVCVGLAAATVVTSALVAMALNNGGAARVGPVTLLELAAGYDVAAGRELRKPNRDFAKGRALTARATRLFPYDTPAWVQLANIETAQHGAFGPEGLRAMKMSYDLVAYDPSVARWRTGLCLEHWSELTPELQKDVTDELTVFLASPAHAELYRTMLAKVRDPAGRAVAEEWLKRRN